MGGLYSFIPIPLSSPAPFFEETDGDICGSGTVYLPICQLRRDVLIQPR